MVAVRQSCQVKKGKLKDSFFTLCLKSNASLDHSMNPLRVCVSVSVLWISFCGDMFGKSLLSQ